MIAVADDLGDRVRLERPARRVVSLVPSLTETLFVLGRGKVLVGATRYCTEPAGALGGVERVGGTKNPDVERICQLRPELILVNVEENRREDFLWLQERGLTIFVTFPRHPRDVVDLLGKLGVLVGADGIATSLAGELRRSIASVARRGGCPPVRVFCPIWKGPWMSFNDDTYAAGMLGLAGAQNVCGTATQRYCPIDLHAVASAAPDVVLLPDEPFRFRERHLPALEPLARTPALRAGRVHFVDGKALSWYGARTAAGVSYLRGVLFPEGERAARTGRA